MLIKIKILTDLFDKGAGYMPDSIQYFLLLFCYLLLVDKFNGEKVLTYKV